VKVSADGVVVGFQNTLDIQCRFWY